MGLDTTPLVQRLVNRCIVDVFGLKFGLNTTIYVN